MPSPRLPQDDDCLTTAAKQLTSPYTSTSAGVTVYEALPTDDVSGCIVAGRDHVYVVLKHNVPSPDSSTGKITGVVYRARCKHAGVGNASWVHVHSLWATGFVAFFRHADWYAL